MRAVRAGLLAVLALTATAQAPGDPDLLVTVGEVSARGAVLWARAPGRGPVAVEVGEAGAGPLRRRFTGQPAAAADFTVKVPLEDLAAATRYRYQVAQGGARWTGEFVTAHEAATAGRVGLVWSGDLGGGGRCRSPEHGYPVFRAMAGRRPDFFVFVGDTIYADQRCRVPPNVPGRTSSPATWPASGPSTATSGRTPPSGNFSG